jgi:hypothetical protein
MVHAPKNEGDSRQANGGMLDEYVKPDVVLSDKVNFGKEFELVKYESMSEHNGTTRRWYRVFRH